MKWPKHGVKPVSNLNNKDQSPSKARLNRKGMTLIELMISVAISSIVLLAATSIFAFVSDSFVKLVDKDEAESSLTQAAYALRTIAGQAINLRVAATNEIGAAGTGASGALDSGWIVPDLNTATDHPDPFATAADSQRMREIAVFHREAGTNNSDFRSTAIFFRTPGTQCTVNTLDDCSGQLIIVWANNDGPLNNILAGAPQAFQSGAASGLVYSRLVSVDVATTPAGTTNYARDTRITLTARHLLTGSPLDFHYVPFSAPIQNQFTVRIKDTTMEVYVGFRNNYLGRSQLVNDEPERLHGSLYYFPFYSSLRGQL